MHPPATPAGSFSPKPDIILFNEGTNDGANNIVAPMTVVLNNLLTACPGTPIVVLEPFNGAEAANLQAAIANSTSPSTIHYLSTQGFYDTQFGGALHPTGPNDIGKVAPQIANAVRPILMKAFVDARAVSAEEEELIKQRRRQ